MSEDKDEDDDMARAIDETRNNWLKCSKEDCPGEGKPLLASQHLA
jgi:hypothetical protein